MRQLVLPAVLTSLFVLACTVKDGPGGLGGQEGEAYDLDGDADADADADIDIDGDGDADADGDAHRESSAAPCFLRRHYRSPGPL